jgi:DNA polymerase III epsilon subunit-like protein
VDEIGRVRDRLAGAVYAPDAHVCVYWDTETTGLRRKPWWQGDVIVQVGAVVPDAVNGERSFKCDMNPYPHRMGVGAAEVTGLTNRHVWCSPTPSQVRGYLDT